MRKAIVGVSLTLALMEVLFRQLVLIPPSLQTAGGQTGRRKRRRPHITTIRAASGGGTRKARVSSVITVGLEAQE